MAWFGDLDITPEDAARRAPAVAEWITRNYMGQCRLVTLVKHGTMLVGTGVVRDTCQGDFGRDDERIMRWLGEDLRSAVLMQQAIEGQQAGIVANSFEQVGRPVFGCDADGRIAACSRPAEHLLAQRRWLIGAAIHLQAAQPASAKALAAAISRAGRDGVAHPGGNRNALVLRDAAGAPLPVRVHGLADRESFRLSSAVLIAPCMVEQRNTDVAELAAQLFDLTPSEAAVLAHVAGHRGPVAAAQRAGVDVD